MMFVYQKFFLSAIINLLLERGKKNFPLHKKGKFFSISKKGKSFTFYNCLKKGEKVNSVKRVNLILLKE